MRALAAAAGVPGGVPVKPRLLDLFCGAGGAAMGYHRAGFYVVGVDIKEQPNYPFEFVQADALTILGGSDETDEIREADRSGLDVVVRACVVRRSSRLARPLLDVSAFDAIHASPPCGSYSMAANNGSGKDQPRLIAPTRELLAQAGVPYVIENVEGARPHLREPTLICGGALGLGVKALDADLSRHRLFETNWPLMAPPCAHRRGRTIGVYGGGTNSWHRKLYGRDLTAAEKAEAMEIDWMKRGPLEQAIPPAYCELIGHQLMQHVRARAA